MVEEMVELLHSLRERESYGVNGSERESREGALVEVRLGLTRGLGEARTDAWARIVYLASKFCVFDTHLSYQTRKLRT